MIEKIAQQFTAVWNEGNEHLKPVEKPELLSRILSPLQDHAKKSTLLASWLISQTQEERNLSIFRQYWNEAPQNRIQELYRMEEASVETPDGGVLSAYCFHHRLAGPGTRTVLLLNPNCATSSQMPYYWLLEEMASRETPCNFVTFNYRTVGTSTGDLSRAHDLCIDADAMMQFIEDKFATPRNEIALYGWSLGGAVAAQAALLQPNSQAPVVLERTFSTSSKVVVSGLSAFHQIGQFFLSSIVNAIEWELDPRQATQKLLDMGRPVMVIHHPQDPIMKGAASLFEGVKGHPNLRAISLGDIELPSHVNHHIAPLAWYSTEEKRPISSLAADFLLR